MISFEKTEDINLIKPIVTEPLLWQLEYGQNCINPKDWVPEKHFDYILIKEEEKILGALVIRELTKIVLECHSLLLPVHFGTSKSQEVFKASKQWAINKGYFKFWTIVPEVCKQVIDFCLRNKFSLCGKIDNGVIYNNKIMKLYMFEYDLMRGL